MADPVDRGKREEMRFRREALRRQQEAAKPGKQLIVDGVVICKKCREPIPEGRLEMLPDADLCVECKRIEELKERR